MLTAKTLIGLGGCPGWSESSLGAHAILLVLSWDGSFVDVNHWFCGRKLPFTARHKNDNLNTPYDNFHPHMTIYIPIWQFSSPYNNLYDNFHPPRTIFISIWQFSSPYDNFHLHMTIYIPIWQFTSPYDNFHLHMTIFIPILMHSLAFKPQHDKTNKMRVRPAKTQISLGICPVWSESSLCTHWVAMDPRFLHADSEDSDQTGWKPRLIWVFAGRRLILLVLSYRGSFFLPNCKCCQQSKTKMPANEKRRFIMIDWFIVLRLFNIINVILSAVSWPIHTVPGQAS